MSLPELLWKYCDYNLYPVFDMGKAKVTPKVDPKKEIYCPC